MTEQENLELEVIQLLRDSLASAKASAKAIEEILAKMGVPAESGLPSLKK